MGDMKFKVEIKAVGEVRDKDGNLISSNPVDFEPQVMTQDELIEAGLLPLDNEE